MDLKKDARLLRIFLGESDKLQHTALHEVIVHEARTFGLAGATVSRGIMGFGSTSHIRTENILDLSSDLPLIIDIVDTEDKINDFSTIVHKLFEDAGCGGLVTIENVEVMRYTHGKITS